MLQSVCFQSPAQIYLINPASLSYGIWYQNVVQGFIRGLGAPIVVKTSGLAAGKGVIVAQTMEEAIGAVDDLMVKKIYGDAGMRARVPPVLYGLHAMWACLCLGRNLHACTCTCKHGHGR